VGADLGANACAEAGSNVIGILTANIIERK